MQQPASDTISKPDVPLSQDETKIVRATKEAVVAELRRIAELDVDQVITRNYFRVHSKFAESAWNAHFGTWAEFKRQAGITLSRHVARLEKSVAKHASVESYRRIGAARVGWEDTYAKPSSDRFQTILVGTDVHDIDCDPFWRRAFIDTAQRVQPEVICLGGDTFDLPEFSKYTQDPRQWDVVGRIRWVHQFLADLRKACPNTQIDMIEGNHEYRLLRHLAEATPAMQAILSDLHGFTVPHLLGLTQFEVNYVARSDLAAFYEKDIRGEIKTNYKIYHDCFMVHHFPEGRLMGMPGCNGHNHKHIVWPDYSPQFGSYTWQQLGCGHKRAAAYCAGEKWSNGFLLAHIDTSTKHTAMEYIDLRDHAVIGGRWYQRQDDEAG